MLGNESSHHQTLDPDTSENFRWLPESWGPTLTPSDLAPAPVQREIAQLGQFAEIAHGQLSQQFIFANLPSLSQPGFPLDRTEYDALQGSLLVSAFRGTVAGMRGYIAHRPQAHQLVVAFSGTSNAGQGLRNVDARLVGYPGGAKWCAVHAGFWNMYKGVRPAASDAFWAALSEREVREVVLTGHSLGAVMCYLFALDLMRNPASSLPLKLALFGCPRIGNRNLAAHWRGAVAGYRARAAVDEYSVKTLNDAIPALPPQFLGYHHFAQAPFYFSRGYLYSVRPSDAEYSCFKVEEFDDAAYVERRSAVHPRGGHLYYNGRNMDLLLKRMSWLDLPSLGEPGWEERYRERMSKKR